MRSLSSVVRATLGVSGLLATVLTPQIGSAQASSSVHLAVGGAQFSGVAEAVDGEASFLPFAAPVYAASFQYATGKVGAGLRVRYSRPGLGIVGSDAAIIT